MKWKDIPKFTGDGRYNVNLPLRSLQQWLDEQITKYGLQTNPDFQRNHVWTESQQIKYIEFLLKGGRFARTLYFNCPSWMRGDEGEYNEFVLVDGLQRLTAALKFLNGEIAVFNGLRINDFEGKMPLDIDFVINVNELQSQQEVLRWYIEINEGGTPHSKEEIERVKKLLEEID